MTAAKRTTRGEKPTEQAVAPSYTPTAKEQSALDAFAARRTARAPAPRMKISKTGTTARLAPDHPHHLTGQTLLMEAIGSADYEFLDGLLAQVGFMAQGANTVDYERNLNFVLSVIRSIKPRDEIEAMLASQMAAVQMAAMTFARRLATVETIPQQDSAERTYNKLLRTFTMQMDALKRYRATAQQVVVKHITVNADQAVVTDSVVNGRPQGGGGAASENERQPHAKQLSHAPVAPLWSENQEREPVPIGGDDEREVSYARRRIAGST